MRTIGLLTVCLTMLIFCFAAPAQAATGGPDPYGYTWDDGEPYAWNDISDGALLALGEEDVSDAIDLGFQFVLYGRIYSSIQVASNGHLTFNGSVNYNVDCDWENRVLTHFAGHWADLDPSAAGEVYYKLVGAAPARKFVVQFTAVPEWDDEEDVGTFQIVLEEQTMDLVVILNDTYDNLQSIYAQNGAIGIHGGDFFLQYECDASPGAAETAIRFAHPADIGLLAAADSPFHVFDGQIAAHTFHLNLYNGEATAATVNAAAADNDWMVSVTPGTLNLDPGQFGEFAVELTPPTGRDLGCGERDRFAVELTGDLTETVSLMGVYIEDFAGDEIFTDDQAAAPTLDGVLAAGEYELAGQGVRFDPDHQAVAYFFYGQETIYFLVEFFDDTALSIDAIQGFNDQIALYFDPEQDGWDADGSDGSYFWMHIPEDPYISLRYRPILPGPTFGEPVNDPAGVAGSLGDNDGYVVYEGAVAEANWYPDREVQATADVWFLAFDSATGEQADWLGIGAAGSWDDPSTYGRLHINGGTPTDDDTTDDDIADDDDAVDDDAIDDDAMDDDLSDDDLADDDLTDDDAADDDDDDNDDGCGC